MRNWIAVQGFTSRWLFCLLVWSLLYAVRARADEPTGPKTGPVNLPFRTLGGTQFWSDVLVDHNWRIQRNVYFDHYRLLDNDDYRHAWGTYEACLRHFSEIKSEKDIPPMQGRVVVVLHGLARTREGMSAICQYLYEHGEYQIVNVGYASTREPIGKHAKSLARVIDHLGDQVTEIHFVAHSLGNLVIRHYMGDATANGKALDPRIRRMVMLTPPNNGAKMAEALHDHQLFRAIVGASGSQLGPEWEKVSRRLAVPPCEFAIIAASAGRNLLLEGQDDWVVSIEETKLTGARDFVVIPERHSGVLENKAVHRYILRFLDDGYFISEPARHPLVAERETVGEE